ncbi:MAG: phage tail protein [Kineosporiaceae bacterium]
MTASGERLLDRLPAHLRARDEQLGGLLAALADAVGGELEILERDLDTLYASWFIETCPEWVVPYLADLVGVLDLPPELPGVLSRRGFVANTVAYRRRKGTVAVVEQVARDASGWPAKAVEFFRLLATTTQVNHVRVARPATASLRTPVAAAGPLELGPSEVAQGALDTLAHTAEVRRIASGRGRFGIPNLAAFLFPQQVYDLGWSPATPPSTAGEGWSVHPLGLATPLFAPPVREESIEQLAQEASLPVPLRPRRLLTVLAEARAATPGSARAHELQAALPIAVRIDTASGEGLDPLRVRVRGLENLVREPDGTPLDGWQVMIDAVTGRIHPFRDGLPDEPDSLQVRHSYGGLADVGAGSHDRTATHQAALDDDPYQGDPLHGGPGVTRQVAVLADGAVAPVLGSLAAALDAAENGWAADDPAPGASYVISIGDSARYPVAAADPADLEVAVPAATRLVLVAATWRSLVVAPGETRDPVPGVYDASGLRPRLRGDLDLTGEGGSSVVLDGLVIEGDVVVHAGDLGSLTLSGCTVAGSVRIEDGQGGGHAGAGSDAALQVRVLRSQCGPIRFGREPASLQLVDSTVDAGSPAPAAVAVSGAALALSVQGSTVLGRVLARTLEGSNAILDGRVVIENRQVGCLRYSFAPRASRVPRRYRCSPTPTAGPLTRPGYVSIDRGSPSYLALDPGCPAEIAEGGEGGAEMGVHHHLGRPVRVRAVARLVDAYLPVGLELGVRAPVAVEGS